ncbi:MAG: toll/interleukin-1 receptor domain-containing protein, partial [Candidatus Scalindua sp.]
KYEGDPKTVYTATHGKLDRTVKFARENNCSDLFDIRFGTTASGAIIVYHKIDNEEDVEIVNERLRHAQSYSLKFTPPIDGTRPYLDIEIYKGFDRGNRNTHFHLYDRRKKLARNYHRMTYTLDLSDFKSYKRPFRQNSQVQPGLWHDPDPIHDCKERAESILKNAKRNDEYRIPIDVNSSKPKEWVWTWELNNIKGGIIDVIWENFLIPPYDVFVSHASEDKEDFVDALVKKLEEFNLEVWYDKNELTIGDDIQQNIISGIEFSLTGIVVLSPHFFDRNKSWTKEELNKFLSRKEQNSKVILPVLHNMSVEDLRKENPGLADVLGAKSDEGVDHVAEKIAEVIARIKAQKNSN